jgi:hypothetical protein
MAINLLIKEAFREQLSDIWAHPQSASKGAKRKPCQLHPPQIQLTGDPIALAEQRGEPQRAPAQR